MRWRWPPALPTCWLRVTDLRRRSIRRWKAPRFADCAQRAPARPLAAECWTLPDAVEPVRGAAAARSDEVAFVFGGERYGLANDDVMRCQAITTRSETSASYTSLNLSQAVQIVAYECQQPSGQARVLNKDIEGEPLASAEDRERMLAHLEEVLVADRLHQSRPKPRRLMQRLRRMFCAHYQLEAEEVAILRGICTQIQTVPAKPNELRSIKAVLMRGGTSKGLFFQCRGSAARQARARRASWHA